MPSADFCLRLPGTSPRESGRSLEVSSTAFLAHPPDLQSQPLMDKDFVVHGPLVRPVLPPIRFLFVESRVCSTLPSDGPSRSLRSPCASLALRLHQAVQGTCTPKLLNMLDTPCLSPFGAHDRNAWERRFSIPLNKASSRSSARLCLASRRRPPWRPSWASKAQPPPGWRPPDARGDEALLPRLREGDEHPHVPGG
jgi:hypothetical protein